MAYALVVVGASLGGMRALQTVLEGLPAAFAAPVVVVQHCGPGHDSVRRAQLREFSALPVATAEGGVMPSAAIRAGVVETVLPLAAIADYLAGLAYGR